MTNQEKILKAISHIQLHSPEGGVNLDALDAIIELKKLYDEYKEKTYIANTFIGTTVPSDTTIRHALNQIGEVDQEDWEEEESIEDYKDKGLERLSEDISRQEEIQEEFKSSLLERESLFDNLPFRRELISLMNKYNLDSELDIPDFLLGEYLIGCLDNIRDIASIK